MPTVRKGIRLPKALNTRLKVRGLVLDKTRNDVLAEIIETYAAGEPVVATASSVPSEVIKVEIDPNIWEAALGRARMEQRPLTQAIQEEAERVIAREHQ